MPCVCIHIHVLHAIRLPLSLSLSLFLSPSLFLSLFTSPVNYRGVWNVPFITAAMLISGKLLTQLKDDLPSYASDELEPDMAFAAWMRERVNNFLCSFVYSKKNI